MIAYRATLLVRTKLKPINTEPTATYPYQQHHYHKLNQTVPSIYFRALHKILETLLNDTTKNARYANN